jgi:hypothetical protein
MWEGFGVEIFQIIIYIFQCHLVSLMYGNLVHCVVFCYIFPVLVYCSKQNLATLFLIRNPGNGEMDQYFRFLCLKWKTVVIDFYGSNLDLAAND